MRNIVITVLLLAGIMLSGCEANNSQSQDVQVAHAALEYFSFEDFQSAVRQASGEVLLQADKTQEDSKAETYNLSELSFCYLPGWMPEGAELKTIRVKDNYVVLKYLLGGTWEGNENEMPYGKDELTCMFSFEWKRTADGEERLERMIEISEASPAGDENTGVYYAEVCWAKEPDIVLGHQYFWEQDDYMFKMYVPITEVNDEMFFEAERVTFAEAETNIPE